VASRILPPEDVYCAINRLSGAWGTPTRAKPSRRAATRPTSASGGSSPVNPLQRLADVNVRPVVHASLVEMLRLPSVVLRRHRRQPTRFGDWQARLQSPEWPEEAVGLCGSWWNGALAQGFSVVPTLPGRAADRGASRKCRTLGHSPRADGASILVLEERRVRARRTEPLLPKGRPRAAPGRALPKRVPARRRSVRTALTPRAGVCGSRRVSIVLGRARATEKPWACGAFDSPLAGPARP
jgi:hypothetical protein